LKQLHERKFEGEIPRLGPGDQVLVR
jgi:hypothetical protein